MPSWLGSLRVRITVLATVAVAAALVGASVVLVWAVEQTGVGQVRDAARGEVDRVAAALVAGEPLTAPEDVTFGWSAVLVLVTDEAGEVVDTAPSVGLRASFTRFRVAPNFPTTAGRCATTSRGWPMRPTTGERITSSILGSRVLAGTSWWRLAASRALRGPGRSWPSRRWPASRGAWMP